MVSEQCEGNWTGTVTCGAAMLVGQTLQTKPPGLLPEGTLHADIGIQLEGNEHGGMNEGHDGYHCGRPLRGARLSWGGLALRFG